MTVTFWEMETIEGLVEMATIDWGNGEFTTMTKAEFDILYPNWPTA